MTFTATLGCRVDNLITQIATNLTGAGWTLTDRAADQVWHSTNNQGVTQYIQITEVGTYQYLQFQGWRTWHTGTHDGADGSGTTLGRLYFSSAVVAAATLVNVYMSVSTNRFILFIKGVGVWDNWCYFGGLGSMAGTNDPLCAVLTCGYNDTSSYSTTAAAVLQSYSSGAYWASLQATVPIIINNYDTGFTLALLPGAFSSVCAFDTSKFVLFPLYLFGAAAPYLFRGDMDGLLWLPNTVPVLASLDTVVYGGVTYLVFMPGGQTGTQRHFFTGNYINLLAMAEV